MTMGRYLLILLIMSPFFSCGIPGEGNSITPHDFDSVMAEAKNYFEMELHTLSEEIYDGPSAGTWGENTFYYKMALRDIYWRIDAYHLLSEADPQSPEEYTLRRDEALEYLKSVQDDPATGVWGVPADTANPEFGATIQEIQLEYPDYISQGFFYYAEGVEVSQLYYDHGRTLTTFCRVYLDTEDPDLLPFITRGANWILDKPAVSNVNYNSAVIEGLAWAYRVTGTESYLIKAISMTEAQVFSQAHDDGSFGNEHNREAWYHGFIVSGLAALKMALPSEHSLNTELDTYLARSLVYLQEVTDQGSPYAFQWAGINARVWSEIEDLSDAGKWPELNSAQRDAYANCLYQTVHGENQPSDESGFYRQKLLYHFIQIGNALANHP